MPDLAGIHHISITVTDIERSVPWYAQVLGLTKLMEEKHPDDDGFAIVLGKTDWSMCIGLHTHPTNKGETFAESRTGLDHASFLVSARSDLDAWKAHFTELGVPQSPIAELGDLAVLVFRDPDNVQLELISLG